jgi:hypothetical protein
MIGLHKVAYLIGTLVALSPLAGCASTQIIASDPQAYITVDGVPLGRGVASISKVGLPGTVQVVAKTPDGRTATQPMSRSFGWTAGVFGFFTYGVCFFACWQYPDSLYVVLPTSRWNGPGAWDAPAGPAQYQDPWLAPPPGWQP